MRDVHFAAFCHFLVDLFSILSKLSLQMQPNDLILPVSVSLVKEAMARVECLKSRPIPDGHLAAFLKNVKSASDLQGIALTGSLEGTVKRGGGLPKSLQSEIETAINLCTHGLNERFGILINASATTKSENEAVYGPQVVNDMLILNVDVWPSNPVDLVDHGREQIQRLIEWFRPLLHAAGCNIDAIQDQWVSMKILVKNQFQKMDSITLWQTFLTKAPYKDNFKDVLHVIEIVLVLPISAAQCERAVSAQNRIKSSICATLATSVLEDLIRLSSEGPPVADFDAAPCVDCWFVRDKASGEHARRPHFKD